MTPKERQIWNQNQTAWGEEQKAIGIPAIEQTVKGQNRLGDPLEVNRFDYNLAISAGGKRDIQCTDGSWIRASAILPREVQP